MIYLIWLGICVLVIGAWLAAQQTVRSDERDETQDRW